MIAKSKMNGELELKQHERTGRHKKRIKEVQKKTEK
jgi:hypothetical protein